MTSRASCVRILVVDIDRKTEETLVKVLKRDLAGCNAFPLRTCAALPDTCSASQLLESLGEQIRTNRCHIIIVNRTLLIGQNESEWIKMAQPARCVIHMGSRSDTIEVMRVLDAGFLVSSPIRRSYDQHKPLDLIVRRAIWRQRTSELEIQQEHLLKSIAQQLNEAYDKLQVHEEEIRELLEYLFPEALEISLSPDEITHSGRSVLKVVTEIKRRGDDEAPGKAGPTKLKPQPRVPVFVKIAPREAIAREVSNYGKYIRGRVQGLRHTYLERHDLRWQVGGIVYSFLGSHSMSGGRTSPLRSFADVYAAEEFSEADFLEADAQRLPHGGSLIYDVIQEVFERTWGTLYSAQVDSDTSVVFDYTRVWGKEWPDRLSASDLTTEKVWPWMKDNLPALPDPAKWLQDWLKENQDQAITYGLAITHGDLHLKNILVDEARHVWLIDFERSGWGPRLQDFIEFQFDILTRPKLIDPPFNDVILLYDFYVALAAPRESDEGIRYGPPKVSSFVKAFRATTQLRDLARKLAYYQDHREYLWGLLLNGLYINTLKLLPYRPDEQTRRRRGWLLASIICGRLENWDSKEWPPQHWPGGPVPKGKDITGKFEYDVFISYSSNDKIWVRSELIPRLERADLRVCVDYRDFHLGAPSAKEMERAVTTSRKTVLVLTPHYLDSAWAEFEDLMLTTLDPANRQRRLIPVLRERCELPPHINYLTYANFADPDDIESTWKRLLDALRKSL